MDTTIGPALGSIPSLPQGLLQRSTFKTTIFNALYELIQNLELSPGRRLVEVDLAARFGVSKTPIRESLLLLEKEGLVALVPHVGATVTYLSLDDYEQQLFLQDALEQPALPLVVSRITTSELDSVVALLREIQRAYGARDATTYYRLVVRMHKELFAAARYPRLSDMIDLVLRATRRYNRVFVQAFPVNWEREWDIIMQRFEHVREGDPTAAAAAVQQGHANMLAFARQRVDAGDPGVMPYLIPNEDRCGAPDGTVAVSRNYHYEKAM